MNIPRIMHNHDIQTDMLGQPLHVGDLVLLKGYGKMDKQTFATIIKVNKKTVGVNAVRRYYNHGPRVDRPPNYKGFWAYYPDGKWAEEPYYLKRAGFDTLKLPPDFKDNAYAAAQTLADEHPEFFI